MDRCLSLSALLLASLALLPCLAMDHDDGAPSVIERESFPDAVHGRLELRAGGYWSPLRVQDSEYRAEKDDAEARGSTSPRGAYVDALGLDG